MNPINMQRIMKDYMHKNNICGCNDPSNEKDDCNAEGWSQGMIDHLNMAGELPQS